MLRALAFLVLLGCGSTASGNRSTPPPAPHPREAPRAEVEPPDAGADEPAAIASASTLDELCRNALARLSEPDVSCRGDTAYEPECYARSAFDANGQAHDAAGAAGALMNTTVGCLGVDETDAYLVLAIEDRYQIVAPIAHWFDGHGQVGRAYMEHFEMRDGHAVAEIETYEGEENEEGSSGTRRHHLVACLIEPLRCRDIVLSMRPDDAYEPESSYALRYAIEGNDIVIDRVSSYVPSELVGEIGRRSIADFVAADPH